MTFWDRLPKPFFVMAPMADVTDAAFRALVAKRGKPDVFWTEFVSADGLYSTIEREKAKRTDSMIYHTSDNPLLRDLQFTEEERPIVAQIFSSKPAMIAYAAKLAEKLGFDGVDLNMGCPDRTIEKQGAGACLMKTPELAAELIRAAQDATQDSGRGISNSSYRTNLIFPVSVKTRVGYNKESLEEWLPILLEANPAALTLHLRTRREMSNIPADWRLMKKAVEIRNRVNPAVLLIGNGDIRDLDDARAKIAASGCDGAMLGRAIFGNPWVFAGKKRADISQEEKFSALVELAQRFGQLSPPKHFAILKKHIKAFVTGFDGAAELRTRLMGAESADELVAIVAENTAGA